MRIGIDLGGSKIEGIVLGDDNRVIKRLRVATPQHNYQATLIAIVTLINELEMAVSAVRIEAVGIAAPGSVSRLNGRMKNCNSTCLNNQSVQQDLAQLLARDIRIANDADCFTLSEAQDGAAAQYHSVFGVILGTGVGGGICIHKQLLSGPNGTVGEWGHNPLPELLFEAIAVNDPPRACYCGRSNFIETYLSGPGLEQSYFAASGERLAASVIATRAEQGEVHALEQLDLYQERLAASLATVINLLDPEVIVLGGGISNIASLYREVPQRWLKYVFSDSCHTALVPARFGDASGVRGAAWLWPA